MLPLQLMQVDVEVNLAGLVRPDDHEDTGRWPDVQLDICLAAETQHVFDRGGELACLSVDQAGELPTFRVHKVNKSPPILDGRIRHVHIRERPVQVTTWPVTKIARGDLVTEIAAIKAEPGPDVIVWGGGRFAGALAAADLIDEYRLLVQPLVVGQGRALFDQLPASRHMNFIQARSFPSGIVVHIYRPQHT